MADTHVHSWVRLAEDAFAYRCTRCPATGYRRYGNARKVVPHKVPRTNRVHLPDRALTVPRGEKK